MKYVLSFLLSFCFSAVLVAQDVQGVVTYKSVKKLNFDVDETKLNDEMKLGLAMLKKMSKKTFKLTFNKAVSLYREDENLPPIGMENFTNFGETKIIFKNLEEERYTSQNESFSKKFLVEDELEKHDWKLTNETKMIAGYECFKATKIIEIPVLKVRVSANGFEGEEEVNKKPKMRQQEVVAWYTAQIPISNGPGMYHGLPGLILGVYDGMANIVCDKINVNPKKEIVIKEPEKGTKVNQEEYDQIVQEKQQELENMRGGRGNHNDVEIRIGG